MTFRLDIDRRKFSGLLARRFRLAQRRAGDKMVQDLIAAAPEQDEAMREAARPTHPNQPILKDSIRGEQNGDIYTIEMAHHAIYTDKGTTSPITPRVADAMPVPVRTPEGIAIKPLRSVSGQPGTGWRSKIISKYTRYLADEI